MTKEKLKNLYEKMLLIRRFEEKVKELYRKGEIFGAVHLYIGQEAIAVGVCSCLIDTDYAFSTHRGHGHYLAKTGDVEGAISELMGKASGCSHGYGGSMHMFNPKFGFMGSNGIVGGGIPLALGAAFAARYRKTDNVSVAFFGDGAANQGTFHESLNLAALKNLPLIAVCENNRYAATTPVAASTADEDMTKRAAAYGIRALTVDGNNVENVISAMQKAVNYSRNKSAPFLLDCKTYRIEPHCGLIADIRPKEELKKWRNPDMDPLTKLRDSHPEIFNRNIIDEFEHKVSRRMESAVEYARKSANPEIDDFTRKFELS